MGAARCPKIKKHPGVKLRPLNTASGPYTPGYTLVYSCESTETKQSIKCLDDGSWSEIPFCPDPTNFTCPEPATVSHGSHNGTGAYKVGTILQFKCDNEQILPVQSTSSSSITTSNNIVNNDSYQTSSRLLSSPLDSITQNNITSNNSPTTLATTFLNNLNTNDVDTLTTSTISNLQTLEKQSNNFSSVTPFPTSNSFDSESSIVAASQSFNIDQNLIRYNLTGQRYLRCLPSAKWSSLQPTCSPILPEKESNLKFLLTSAFLIIVPILILIVIAQLVIKWKKRQQQRARWKQYFTDYEYRHSKSSIAFGMRGVQQNSTNATIPVTDL